MSYIVGTEAEAKEVAEALNTVRPEHHYVAGKYSQYPDCKYKGSYSLVGFWGVVEYGPLGYFPIKTCPEAPNYKPYYGFHYKSRRLIGFVWNAKSQLANLQRLYKS